MTHDNTLAYIDAALRGDQTAYRAIYDQFSSGLYRLCYSLLLNQQDAEDVVQDSFVYAFKNLKRYDRKRSAFKTWLYTIAVSRSRNVHRRKRPIVMDLLTLNAPAPTESGPEVQYTHSRARSAINNALSKLSPSVREAVVLRYGHGMTYREIAAVMDCPQKTAESRIRIAHNKLRHLLQAEGPALLEELFSV